MRIYFDANLNITEIKENKIFYQGSNVTGQIVVYLPKNVEKTVTANFLRADGRKVGFFSSEIEDNEDYNVYSILYDDSIFKVNGALQITFFFSDGVNVVGSSLVTAQVNSSITTDGDEVDSDAINYFNSMYNSYIAAINKAQGKQDLVSGYFKEGDKKFYTSNYYEIEIVPNTAKLYVDKNTNSLYSYNGTAYQLAAGEGMIAMSDYDLESILI